ncbi:MAG: cellulase family glycosylhydrolase [Bacteroidota bacterium]
MSTSTRWSIEKANEWYAGQPWLTGCNFIPSNAINQLEMWQAETFDPLTIERELGWAADIGFNTVRTFLHDLAWEADPEGLKQRIGCFLEIATRHGIRPMLVFFDDCWNRHAAIGPQPAPKPGIHNSGWIQSPGADVVTADPSTWGRLERYVTDILTTFANDERILLWDLYNEPGNSNNGSGSLPLLQCVFEWARAVDPSQPLTAGIWFDNKELNKFQLAASDILSFHNYQPADGLEKEIAELELYGRPIICTEWMARSCGSLVGTHLPVFASRKVGCINWGLVAGRTNTIFAWQDLNNPMSRIDVSSVDECGEPKLWFHDLFRPDGTPYDQAEIEVFKKYAAARTHVSQDVPLARIA